MGFDHPEARACEQIAKYLPIVLLILNDEYGLVHYRAACHSTRAGAVNENVAPAPRLESTQMRPPCISTMRFAIARPKARAHLGLGDRAVHLSEFLEDFGLIRFGDAGAGIANGERREILSRAATSIATSP